ncbi:UNVERIFIED_CONTAM: hypothetical protein RF648_19225, partial [Kocuria sp. CPCC 205274]
MRIGISDIEANGFFDTVDLFHCSWIIDPISGERRGYRPHQLKEYINDLCGYDVVVFHNGIDYDIPVLMKLGGEFKCPKIFDTLVLSRMLEPDRPQGHSLKSWGIALGLLKGDYGEQEDAWDVFTEDMFVYCERDVDV